MINNWSLNLLDFYRQKLIVICIFYENTSENDTNQTNCIKCSCAHVYVCTIRSFPYSWLITGFVTTVTRRVHCLEQERFTLRGTWVHPQFSIVLHTIENQIRIRWSTLIYDKAFFACPGCTQASWAVFKRIGSWAVLFISPDQRYIWVSL
jgi:hypothetical protein